MGLPRALSGFIAIAGLFLLIETVLEHREVFSEQLVAWVAVVGSVLGLIAGAVAFFKWNDSTVKSLRMVSGFLILVGLGGLYFHNAHRLGVGRAGGEREEKPEAEERGAPPLAPVSFSGVGVLGLMASHPRWRDDEGKGEAG